MIGQKLKTAPPTGGHVFQRTGTTFELNQHIIKTNILTNFKLDRDFIGMKLVTKFHEEQTINVASRVFMNKSKNALPLGSHVYQSTGTIFETVQTIIGTHLLSKLHEDQTINVTSREKCLAPGGHVFQVNGTIFELVQDIIGNLLTKFCYSHGGHVTKFLTKFHKEGTINVITRVLTRENAPPPCGHVFQAFGTIFELVQDIFGTNFLTKLLIRKNAPPSGGQKNLLTKFHEDWTINVASRVLTRQMLTPHNARWMTGNMGSQKLIELR
ncbi:hypothetical protein DPMN_103669 [Dreissena polymorpha]|uniref:Uncharacterized protein n=1 Tax=Dreissena polymorpha TaxID=45954 RepID=A0A9D4H8H3_DREPO|nr:hypothetical protein DPMN_103669 [Dreissena polymorpha]